MLASSEAPEQPKPSSRESLPSAGHRLLKLRDDSARPRYLSCLTRPVSSGFCRRESRPHDMPPQQAWVVAARRVQNSLSVWGHVGSLGPNRCWCAGAKLGEVVRRNAIRSRANLNASKPWGGTHLD